jgi:hypothetical protein
VAHQWAEAGFSYSPETKKLVSSSLGSWGVPTKPTTVPPTKAKAPKKAKAVPEIAMPPAPVAAPAPKPFQLFGTEAQQKKQWNNVQISTPSGQYWQPSEGKWASTPDPIYGPGGSYVGAAPPHFVFDPEGEAKAFIKTAAAAPAVEAPALEPKGKYADDHVPGASNYEHLSQQAYWKEHDDYVGAKWWNNLSPAEQQAVPEYTGSAYKYLNKEIYEKTSPSATNRRLMRDLDAAFKKAPPLEKPLVVHRGMGTEILDSHMPGWQTKNLSALIGEVVTSAGYTSTSGVAGSEFEKAMHVRLRIPAGVTRAAFIRKWSRVPNENEILLARDTDWRIINAERKGGRVVLDVEVLPKIPPDAPGTGHPS